MSLCPSQFGGTCQQQGKTVSASDYWVVGFSPPLARGIRIIHLPSGEFRAILGISRNYRQEVTSVADANAVRLVEGARVLVQCTVNENKAEGAILKDAPYKVQTRADGGERYIQRNLVYPFPAGLIDDPFTGKKGVENMTPQQLAQAIEAWGKQIELLKTAGGKVVTQLNGKDVEGLVPTDVIPTPAEIYVKGFKLEIQGPVNSQMRKDQLVVKGKSGTITKGAKNITDIG